MIPDHEMLNKIKWDKNLNPDEYTIVYLDRIVNKGIEIHYKDIIEHGKTFMLVNSKTGPTDIPLHRIKMIKQSGKIIWARELIEVDSEKSEELDDDKAASFLGIEKSNIKSFDTVTPKGNRISGWIVLERADRMGSLLIDKVNGRKTLQYVTGMPKIHYNDELKLDLNSFDKIRILEKLDGTNLVFFPLIVDGKVIEVCSKTRLMVLTQEKWMPMINELLKRYPQIVEAVEKEKVSISAEMFGYNNLHAVDYKELGIALDLQCHTILDKGKSLPFSEADRIIKDYDLPFVDMVFDENFVIKYEKFISGRRWYGDFNDYYIWLESFFEEMNRTYQEKSGTTGTIIIEGAVWHLEKGNETFMLKNKATTVKETHIKVAAGIGSVFIHQAVSKVFENLSADEFKNKEKVLELVKKELSEDFIPEVISDRRVERRIDNMYDEFVVYQDGLEYYREIAKKVNQEVGKDSDISQKLRKFAEMYPKLKGKSNTMYRIFSKQV